MKRSGAPLATLAKDSMQRLPQVLVNVRVTDKAAVAVAGSVADAVADVQRELGEAGTARPGQQVAVVVELGKPVALGNGLGFVIREGGKTVGAGTVTAVLG